MTNNREQEAVSAYTKFLQGKGISVASLTQRRAFLQTLTPVIKDTFGYDLLYRRKLEALLETKDKATWPYCLTVAREFYLFWTKDIKAIAAMIADDGFDLEPPVWQPLDSDLQTLWVALDKLAFNTAEMWSLKSYALALRQHGADQTLIDTRVKLVKLLLMRLRDSPNKNLKTYRNTVDRLIPLFEMKDTRHLFIAVAHEFYNFWNGDPNASDFVLIKSSVKGFQ